MIFRVNGHVVAANDLAIRLLSSAVTVPALGEEGEADAQAVDCQWANELQQAAFGWCLGLEMVEGTARGLDHYGGCGAGRPAGGLSEDSG